MTTAFCVVQDVRDVLELNQTATSKYADPLVQSNIYAASAFLERATWRYFADRTFTVGSPYRATTEGAAAIPLPGFRSVTSVTLAGTALAADSTYYLLPDAQQTGIYTAIQFRPFAGGFGTSYGSNPEWFDRGLDLPDYRVRAGYGMSSQPNDLAIAGSAGYADPIGSVPFLAHATKFLAAHYTLHPQALLAGAQSTPEGAIFDVSSLPDEVTAFIAQYKLGGTMVVSA